MKYTGTHEEQMRQYRAAMDEYEAKRDSAMQDAGVKVGDVVEYHAVGSFHHVEIRTGKLYIAKNGAPKVKVGTKSYPWHKGYRKIT